MGYDMLDLDGARRAAWVGMPPRVEIESVLVSTRHGVYIVTNKVREIRHKAWAADHFKKRGAREAFSLSKENLEIPVIMIFVCMGFTTTPTLCKM